jgi:hypothetical protein
LAYLDDANVVSQTFQEQLDNLRKVFQRFRGACLKINPEKCQLLWKEVQYLEGVTIDLEKLEAVQHWPPPTDKHKLWSFLVCVPATGGSLLHMPTLPSR